MAAEDELQLFVRSALSQGVSRLQITDALRQAGWEEDKVARAVDSFAEVDFPVPVPRPKTSVSAREAFLYLLLFATLYVSAFNLGNLLFQFINLGFPEPTDPEGFPLIARGSIRWAVASLVIAFPVFLFVSRIINREVGRDPVKKESSIRKWLTYMTLFVAAGIIIGDLIALVYSFLSGELTVRFVLKVLTIGVIAGGVFGYYLRDVRSVEDAP
ncbi:MAG: DUF5671 domain-containing protein [Rhodothermales bacterium]|nr:DUF5671 domain-containing protein [Rhodothermales bacterium]